MIREIAQIRIRPGKEEAFRAAVAQAVPIFRAAEGCRAMHLEEVLESPGLFRLHVLWETLEAHTEGFRNSQGYTDWRALVGGFFAEPPQVDHSRVAVAGFDATGG